MKKQNKIKNPVGKTSLENMTLITREVEKIVKKLPLYARVSINDVTTIVSTKLNTKYKPTYDIIKGYLGLRVAQGDVSINKGGPGIKREI